MPRGKYHPDYKKVYPGIEIEPKVLETLQKGDRKAEYWEVDIKREQFISNQERKIAKFLPSREDSYDRLPGQREFAIGDEDMESGLIWIETYEYLRSYIKLLSKKEQELLELRYRNRITQEALAHLWGISQQAISQRENSILKRLREFFEKSPCELPRSTCKSVRGSYHSPV